MTITVTMAKQIETQITQQLLQRRAGGEVPQGDVRAEINPWADRLIAIFAVTAGLCILGSYLEEVLWAVVAAATVFTLR